MNANVQLNFMLKMTKMDFNQHCFTRKDSKKSYQVLEKRNLKLTIQDLCQIFHSDAPSETSTSCPVTSEDDDVVLKRAFALSKSDPRQIGRNRWRENMVMHQTCYQKLKLLDSCLQVSCSFTEILKV